MKIHFDIGHPAQLNFYKNVILKLSKNNRIFVTYINRGKLPAIVQKELGEVKNCNLIKIGNHRGTILSVIIESNFLRPLILFVRSIIIKPDIEISNGYQAGIYSKFAGIPSIHFSDDPERGKFFIALMKFFAKEIYFPFYSDEKIKPFKALKEWAYLSPNYFIPNNAVLINYGIKKKQYIFIREVITSTLNYRGQESRLIESIVHLFPKNLKVLLSLEDKSRLNYYPDDWVILEEPIEDIHSLIFYSRLVISSGDSMSREGAQLGVPSVYCGEREMFANKLLIEKQLMLHENINNVPLIIKNNLLFDIEDLEIKQQKIRNALYNEWDDITNFIIKKINKI